MVDDHNDAGRVEKLRVGRSMSILRGEEERSEEGMQARRRMSRQLD